MTNERNTDITAVESRRVALTPLHFDLTHHAGVKALTEHDLERLLEEPVERADMVSSDRVPTRPRRRAPPSCAGCSTITPTAITCSTTRRSVTPSTTRSTTS